MPELTGSRLTKSFIAKIGLVDVFIIHKADHITHATSSVKSSLKSTFAKPLNRAHALHALQLSSSNRLFSSLLLRLLPRRRLIRKVLRNGSIRVHPFRDVQNPPIFLDPNARHGLLPFNLVQRLLPASWNYRLTFIREYTALIVRHDGFRTVISSSTRH
jgi:hypothetical protein